MTESATDILVVDPDAYARAFLVVQLKSLGLPIHEASNGSEALQLLSEHPVKVVVTELYLEAGGVSCLIAAIRADKRLRKTRTLAHTNRSTAADREWALQVGADAYLIKPTRAERMRYVVGRLTSERGAGASVPPSSTVPIVRRDSLDAALRDVEQGSLAGTSAIVFARVWWQQQSPSVQATYRRRAKAAHVRLHSDALLRTHFVEVRGPSGDHLGVSSEHLESPYRKH